MWEQAFLFWVKKISGVGGNGTTFSSNEQEWQNFLQGKAGMVNISLEGGRNGKSFSWRGLEWSEFVWE